MEGMEQHKTTSCIVIDQDIVALRVMKSYISRVGNLSLLHLFDDTDEAIDFLRDNDVNIVFWNLESSYFHDRTEVLNHLDYRPELIVTSMALPSDKDALSYEVSGWLTKPLASYLEFSRVVDDVLENITLRRNGNIRLDQSISNLFVKVDSSLESLSLEEVFWVEAYGDYVKIHTVDKMHVILSKFQFFIEKLPLEDFAQVHRSHLVRLDKISKIEQANILVGRYNIPISRSFKKEFLNKIVVL